MSDPKGAIHSLILDYYDKNGISASIAVAKDLLHKYVTADESAGLSSAKINTAFNGELCESVLEILIKDFMKRNPTRTKSWRYNKSVILSDLESKSSKFLTEIDALLFTPERIYVFECKSYTGEKRLIGNGVIKRKKGNDCDVFAQNSLHLKMLTQWISRFSRNPKFLMVLFDFSIGDIIDERSAGAKKKLRLVDETSLFSLLREQGTAVWRAEDLDLISKQFDRETQKLRAKHLDYVTHLNRK